MCPAESHIIIVKTYITILTTYDNIQTGGFGHGTCYYALETGGGIYGTGSGPTDATSQSDPPAIEL